MVQTITQYVRNAVISAPVQEALTSGRYWREVPVCITWNDGEILEGAIDLLYADATGSLHVVDYKTDHISETQMTTRSEEDGASVATILVRRRRRISSCFAGASMAWTRAAR